MELFRAHFECLGEQVSPCVFQNLLFCFSEISRSGPVMFPLLDAATSSPKMFVPSPLAYIENQCSDILTSIGEISSVPNITTCLQKVNSSFLFYLSVFSVTCFII